MKPIPGIQVENASKKFCRNIRRALRYGAQDILDELTWWRTRQPARLRSDEFWAVQDVSFALQPGQALGVIGENGAGKSTLLKMLHGLLKPDAGRIEIRGRICAMDLGAGMIPLLTGRENIFAQAALLGYSRRDIQRQLDSIIAFAELENFIDTTVGFYSTGMRSRLAFAVAAHLEPDILLVDEILAVGDLAFQRKCLTYINDFLQRSGMLVLVSHSLYHIQGTCQQGLVLEHGRVACLDNAVNAMDFYLKRKNLQDNPPPDAAALPEPARQALAPLTDQEPVRIDRVVIGPLESPILQTGKPAQIQLFFTSLRRIERVTWSFVIYNQDQSICITGAQMPKAVVLPEGPGVLSCVVPQLPLTNGAYVLKIGLSDLDAKVPLAQSGWLDSAYQFQVNNEADSRHNMSALLKMLVTLEVNWEGATAAHA